MKSSAELINLIEYFDKMGINIIDLTEEDVNDVNNIHGEIEPLNWRLHVKWHCEAKSNNDRCISNHWSICEDGTNKLKATLLNDLPDRKCLCFFARAKSANVDESEYLYCNIYKTCLHINNPLPELGKHPYGLDEIKENILKAIEYTKDQHLHESHNTLESHLNDEEQ